MTKPFSTRVGELFAHIQDLTDTIVHTLLKRARGGKGSRYRLVKFIATLGDAYFHKYSEIKAAKKKPD